MAWNSPKIFKYRSDKTATKSRNLTVKKWEKLIEKFICDVYKYNGKVPLELAC